MSEDCRICEINDRLGSLPVRERVYVNDSWRVAHAWSTLPGWLIVAPLRHVEALDELSDQETATLGPLLGLTTRALREILGCEKTYVVLFAEQPTFSHLHIHVVPRMADFTAGEVGPGVFQFLNQPESAQVPAAERDRLSAEIGALIASSI